MKDNREVFQFHLPFGLDEMRNSIVLYTVSLAAITLIANVCNYYLSYLTIYANSRLEFTLSQVADVLLPLVVFAASYFISAIPQKISRWIVPAIGSVVGSLIGTETGWLLFGHYFFPLDWAWTAIFNSSWSAYVAAAIGGGFAEKYLRTKKEGK